ncbi:copper resistance CopC family protein [Cryobacterium melibiosiphilum]|uniref:copper resistance CopC family protein n=1 Tax=Cryobacterium melibiosiphilum TaxID=995039 RepID=UPI001313F0E9|nr:copper resistance CopC family protein [Cryobacterium melibiosiphilum]
MARTLVFGAVTAVALLLPMALAAPASAHDQVTSTVPAEGEHLDTAPTEVSMTFTSDILEIGAIMLVVDTHGEDWADGQPHLDGDSAVQALTDGVPDGAYQVRWRVVSADGHPISGTVDFTVGIATTPTDAAGTEPTSPAAAIGGVTTGPGTDPVTDQAAAQTIVNDFPLWLTSLIGASVGLGIYLLTVFRRRPRTTSPTRNPTIGNLIP